MSTITAASGVRELSDAVALEIVTLVLDDLTGTTVEDWRPEIEAIKRIWRREQGVTVQAPAAPLSFTPSETHRRAGIAGVERHADE